LGLAHYGFVMVVLTFYSPVIIWNQFTGGLDGECYDDNLHQAGAAGLFVLFSFVACLRYWWCFVRLNPSRSFDGDSLERSFQK
jgi:hypothetical protein